MLQPRSINGLSSSKMDWLPGNHLLLTGAIQFLTSSVVAWSDTATLTREVAHSSSSCGTSPTVDTVTYSSTFFPTIDHMHASADTSAFMNAPRVPLLASKHESIKSSKHPLD